MMSDLITAKEMLAAGKYTCVLCKSDRIYTSVFRGVKPLVKWYSDGYNFKDFSAADRVVGKATAFLYCLLGVKAVYAGVISKSALSVLQNAEIKVQYATLAENIINRSGDGICPFEAAVTNIDDMLEAYEAIKIKMAEMNIEF